MSISLFSSSAKGYMLSQQSSSAAVQSIHSAESAAVQSVSIATSDAVRTVKTAEYSSFNFYESSAGGVHHQVSAPTDLSNLVKGG